MTNVVKKGSILLPIAVVGIILVLFGFLLFNGYLDYGKFEIVSSQWSPSNQVAIVGKRSDNQALNSDQYFVFVVGGHLPSWWRLRREYYSDDVIFRASNKCLTLRWASANELVITCLNSSIRARSIAVQKRQSGRIDISYVNIPEMEPYR